MDAVSALWVIMRCALTRDIYVDRGAKILDSLAGTQRFNKWMADVVRPHVGDRILEIGAGIGNMSVNLMPRSIYWATDVNPAYLNYLESLRTTRPDMRSCMQGSSTDPAGHRIASSTAGPSAIFPTV